MSEHVWTHEQFEHMSWHDNHVHALGVVEGEYGLGDLVLDLDYILEWIKDGDCVKFKILPVTLRFFQVSDLRISLDWAARTAALGPFSIHAIERRVEQRERYEAQLWTIAVNWPNGEITFEAAGYEQRGDGEPVLCEEQHLHADQRGARA
jgi:hypothetical protein